MGFGQFYSGTWHAHGLFKMSGKPFDIFWMGYSVTCYKFPWADMTWPGSHDLDPGSQGKPVNSPCISFETECIQPKLWSLYHCQYFVCIHDTKQHANRFPQTFLKFHYTNRHLVTQSSLLSSPFGPLLGICPPGFWTLRNSAASATLTLQLWRPVMVETTAWMATLTFSHIALMHNID